MQSSLKLNSSTFIGRDEEKKLSLILSFLIDSPEAAQFLHPVDWQELELNDYPLVVKHPMNLLKVLEKFKAREYRTAEECLDHIQLVWDNCKEYNQEGYFYNLADKLDRSYKKMIKNYLPNIQITVPSKLTTHLPPTPPQSVPHRSQARPQQRTSTHLAHAPHSFQEPVSLNEPNQHPQVEIEEVPQNEKNRFHQRLRQLTQQELAQIVLILQENCAEGFKEFGLGKYQILLDLIDAETFKRMNQKIDEIMDGEKMMNGSKRIKV